MYIHIVYMYIQSVFFPNPHDSSPNVQTYSKSLLFQSADQLFYIKNKLGRMEREITSQTDIYGFRRRDFVHFKLTKLIISFSELLANLRSFEKLCDFYN